MKIIYHGHSFIEIESEYGVILIDPFITHNPLCDIKSPDFYHDKHVVGIVVTHGHGDHIGDTIALAALHPQSPIISTSGVISWLVDQGVVNTTYSPSIGGSVQVDHMTVKMTPAQHDARVMDSMYYSQPAGVIVTMNNRKIYHAGDTGLITDLQLIKQWGPIDVAFVPIGDYYTMGVDDAVAAINWIQPTTVVPIHYNTFPQIKSDPMEFCRRVMLDKSAVPKMLIPGQYIVL